MKFVDWKQLHETCVGIFTAAGVPEADADDMAEVLILADMRGIASHGVVRSRRYIECIQCGGIRPDAPLRIVEETPVMLRTCAGGGLGIPASCKTLRRMLEKAVRQPIAIATVNHSDHFGAAGYYALKCAEAGLIGFSMSNTCPLVAVTGAAEAGIGNNPFAYAAPAGRYRAVLYDVCMSVVARGKIEIALQEKRRIPEGWILNREGRPTTDPADSFNGGVMLPFGGHKGYGFALMVELLSGVLADAGTLENVHSWNTVPGEDSNTGHCFGAINPEFFGGLKRFVAETERVIEKLCSGRRAPGVERIFYPGEIEFQKEKAARERGVPLGDASLEELRGAASLTGAVCKL